MSIATEIQRLQQAKSDLKTSIQAKGVTVSSEAKLDEYPDLVDSIQTGGDMSAYVDWIEGNTYDIPNGVTKIKPYAFAGTKTTPVIPSSVTELDEYCFTNYKPTNTTSLVIPTTVKKVGSFCFYNIGNSSTYLSVSILGVTNMSEYLFDHAYLTSFPTLNSSITEIPANCFSYTNFQNKTLQIPSHITDINAYAFGGANITKIIIPESVVYLGNASINSYYLKTIHFLGTTPPFVKNETTLINSSTKIYVPDEAIDTYKVATGFSDYASQIYPVSEMPA